MTAKPHFEVVEDQPATPQQTQQEHAVAVKMMTMALGALAQRTLHALADLFCLLTVGSAFWLFISIPDPNRMQLIQLGGYCAFVLLANLIVRRG